jgi:C-terminal processing protease CtpA/Prc
VPFEWTRELESMSFMHGSFSPQIALGGWRQWTVPFRFGKWKYTQPLVVMISNVNISSGESLAQALKFSNRAVLVGNQTNGTYGSRDGITLPGGARFEFTVGRALFPSGEKYHRIGIQPDVEVTPTIAGLRAGRDETLDVAVATLKKLVACQVSTVQQAGMPLTKACAVGVR